MKMKYILLSLILYMFVSCQFNNEMARRTSLYKDSIIVSFYQYIFETSISIEREELYRRSKKREVDEIVPLDDKQYNDIRLFVVKHYDDSLNKKCDSRIIVSIDTFMIGIPDFPDLGCISDRQDRKSRYLLYLIKWKSGFYNYLSIREELKYDELIKEFGIPNNYMSHKPVIGGIRKIMFVRDKESQTKTP